MLEVEIVEVKRSRLMELGIQWPGQLSLAPLQTAGVPLTLNQLRNLNSNTIQATVGSVEINARKHDDDSTILANPRIRVRNKEKAKVLIGERVPVITTTSLATGFVAESVSYLDVGLKLEVEPNVHLDEEVAIKINLEVSGLTKEVSSKTGTLAYQVSTRGASTVLRLKDGETQVLAGLISDEDRTTSKKIPGLGDLPIVGRLFGSQKDDGLRSEILLSITPRILRSIRRQDLAVAEFESGTESSMGAPSLRLNSVGPDVQGLQTGATPVMPAATLPVLPAAQ
jgi:general secretion pathway protein D